MSGETTNGEAYSPATRGRRAWAAEGGVRPEDAVEAVRRAGLQVTGDPEGDSGTVRVSDQEPLSAATPLGLERIDWMALGSQARETLDREIPPTPARERLGIQDVARASGLSVQQIRLLEHHGLVTPALETSGEKRNRRYTREQAILIIVAALVMHILHIRPGKAAMLVLAQRAYPIHTPRSALELGTGHESTADPYAADTLPEPTYGARYDHNGASDAPETGMLSAATARLRSVVAPRLAVVAVSSLLGERDLPAQWVIHVREGVQGSFALAGASVAAPPGAEGTDSMMELPIAHGEKLDPTRYPVPDGSAFYAFVAPGGEIFRFLPSSREVSEELLAHREWHAVVLPAARGRPSIEVLIGAPRRAHPSAEALPARRLMGDRLAVRTDTVLVAAALLWLVIRAIPEVTFFSWQRVHDGVINLEGLAQRGVTTAVLWLYAQVLLHICPDLDQCDILEPHADPGGERPVLQLIASSNLDELRVSARAMIHGDQLLSGFAYSLAQPCYVADVNAAQGVLISYRSEERARAAAAIPVTYGRRARACVYLFSRHASINFTPVLRRTLEVAVNEMAEVLLLHELALQLASASTLHIVRPRAVGDAGALQQVVEDWVNKLAIGTPPPAAQAVDDSSGWLSMRRDDGRFVAVVIGAEHDSRFREQPEVARWLDSVAHQTADSFAQTLDAGGISDERSRTALAVSELRSDGHSEAFAPFTRVFRWPVASSDPIENPRVAYVVLAGLDLTREHVQRIKRLIHARGLDGRIAAHTGSGLAIGRLLAWVLDAKATVIERTLYPLGSGGGGAPDITRAVQRIMQDIDTCSRILAQQHQFHHEAFREGNLDRAIVTLKQALTKSSGDVYVLRHLLDLYVRAGRLDNALALAEEHRDREDVMPAKWFCSMGQAHLMLGDADAALREFKEAIQRDPSHPLPYRLMAEAHAVQGQFDAAAQALREALAHEEVRSMHDEERTISTYLLLGDVLERQGKLDAALATYEELLVTHPQAAKDNILVSQRILSARWHRRADVRRENRRAPV
jgi:MalT-like TPR region